MKRPIQADQKAQAKLAPAPNCRRQACLDAAGDESLMFIDGHDGAIMGVAEVDGEARVVYDIEAIVRELMRRDGMDRKGAIEFFEYNIAPLGESETGPLFLLCQHRVPTTVTGRGKHQLKAAKPQS